MNILLAAYSYIAALVGAGFASGQEILSFFVVYGKAGVIGIILSSVIFGYFAYFILNISRRLNVNEYNTLISKAFNGFGERFVYILTFVFTCVVYCVMTAGMGEMLHLLWGVKTIWGNILTSIFNIKDYGLITSILNGCIEMTRGLINLGSLNLDNNLNIYLSSFLIAFGGISIFLQSLNFTKELQIKKSYFLFQKLCQGFITLFVSVIFCLIFN